MYQERKKTDLIIIGAGTAGLSAAIYACRAGLRTLVFERE
ncbi:MAG: FAD-binding protein, partial [Lachnospiraceae bacterium]|nr:FAD-binding protein [Lachnospiraceae bacterium]